MAVNKLLVEITGGLSVMDLVNLCSMNKLPISTKISVMGAESRYVVIDKDTGSIVIDEVNPLQDDEEYNTLYLRKGGEQLW